MEIYTTTSPLLYNEHYRLMNMKNEILYSSSTTGMMKAVMKENKNTTNIVEEQTSSPRSVATDIDQILSAPWKENLHHDNTSKFFFGIQCSWLCFSRKNFSYIY